MFVFCISVLHSWPGNFVFCVFLLFAIWSFDHKAVMNLSRLELYKTQTCWRLCFSACLRCHSFSSR